jgi:N-terminal half of MaoC dehydratase
LTVQAFDTSDIDRHLGIPIETSPIREAIGNNDIRRWVQAMHYPNLLHFDPTFATASRWGRLVAPQSFVVAADDAQGTAPACVGLIPQSHVLFGGDEWWFEDVAVSGGDILETERIPFDYAVKETRFAGPTCFQRGDTFYRNQDGKLIAKQRSTAIRYIASAGSENTNMDDAEETEWSDGELEALEGRKLGWIRMLQALGHDKRWWDEVRIGDELPERVFGPHTIASFATEWRSFMSTVWGAMDMREIDLAAIGFVEKMSASRASDPDLLRINPEIGDGAYYGPARGHLSPKWARSIGMPRGYGYGASMGAWITDYLAGWAGEWGLVVHSIANYRGPALTGDITVQTGEVIDKFIDDNGRPLIQIRTTMTNQKGGIQATATAEIALPKRA